MLSYQHIYHAGNLADVHKHSLLAWMLDYLTRKEKPVSYLETHAGRALYDLSDAAARKTGEAAVGIDRAQGWFGTDHPYARAIAATRAHHGAQAYPGSPWIARHLLRPADALHLAELHPQEQTALGRALGRQAKVYRQDGFDMALSLVPPTPRRGMILIDPSYERPEDYARIPRFVAQLDRMWNVGIIAVWYPILTHGAQTPMVQALAQAHPDALIHEVRFAPARPGHRMVGSGMAVLRPPFGLIDEAQRLGARFATL
ncbi:MAG: 23S rRNA (adenine(2030)-N(6))-methyltransferase RlmJ [Primorskyibacter sp.]